jgi:hypothetical protein
MSYKQRVHMLKTLITGSVVQADGQYADILNEFDETYKASKITKAQRKYLLQVLHSTRAMDSALRAFTDYHRIPPRRRSLGGYLHSLEHHGNSGLHRITNTQKNHYQTNIVNVRNHYMHDAGAFPISAVEIHNLLSEMESCLVLAFSL